MARRWRFRLLVVVFLALGSAVRGVDESGARTTGPSPVSKPTPTVEAGMPLFSSSEISHLFQVTIIPEKKEHPIFVGMDDDVVEMAVFNVYSDRLTMRQSLDARLSDAGWQAMLSRLEELDPKLAAETFYEKRSADRFFNSQAPGGAVDRPNPGAIDFRPMVESALKAIREIGD